ncbi:hypothetical protein DITRI_Ditri13aG0109800 [Diplodiscus trichospermus]
MRRHRLGRAERGRLRLAIGSSEWRWNVVDEDDDDCVVLEGDTDKALSDVNDPQEDSDELLIVGQKGQIACRDFAHPRHDCARFPFSSTSHEQHCELKDEAGGPETKYGEEYESEVPIQTSESRDGKNKR